MSYFIEAWQKKLYSGLESCCGKDTADSIMNGHEKITGELEAEDIIRWTAETVRKIEDGCSPEQLHDILIGCSCLYPIAKLENLRQIYVETGDVDRVIEALQNQLEDSLRNGMLFEDEIVDKFVEWGWGTAGKRDGNRILITKIPKSGNIRQYMSETDPTKKRMLYCHCPRVNKAVELGIELPLGYCLCGAGYYLQIWETILDRKVTVEITESVCSGGDCCSIVICLPEDCA